MQIWCHVEYYIKFIVKPKTLVYMNGTQNIRNHFSSLQTVIAVRGGHRSCTEQLASLEDLLANAVSEVFLP